MKALLVGINNYPNPENQLNGCIDDVTDMQALLVGKAGFAAGDVTMLTDSAATRNAIYAALQTLVSGSKAGDHLVFHYSGHGCQMPEKNATGTTVAVHDAMCPYDFDWTPAHAIQDTDFQALFSIVPSGVHLSWISDSCYSGGYTKLFAHYTGLPIKRIIKTIPPPPSIHEQIASFSVQQNPTHTMRDIAQSLSRVVLLSACSSNQEASDAQIGTTWNGAFTYYLLDTLNGANGLLEAAQQVVGNAGSELQANGYSQTPELHGDATLFSSPTI